MKKEDRDTVFLQAPFHAYKGEKPFIFVSFAHLDRNRVYPEILRLHSLGYRIWYDEGIEPGTEFYNEIAKAIEKSSIFIVFISQNAVESQDVRHEIAFALKKNIKILPIYLESTELSEGLELQIGVLQGIMKFRLIEEMYNKEIEEALPTEVLEEVENNKLKEKEKVKDDLNKKMKIENWQVEKLVCPKESMILIIATIGPTVYLPKKKEYKSEKKDLLEELIKVGAGAFQINFSHVSKEGEICDDNNVKKKIIKYSYDDVKKIIKRIREIEEELEIPIPIIMGLKGPEIRVLDVFEKGSELKQKDNIFVQEGEIIHLWQESKYKELPSNDNINKLITITFDGDFARGVETRSIIRINDGRIELQVIGIENDFVIATVKTSGKIEKSNYINLPGIELEFIDSITEKDKYDLAQCFDVDIIAQSFVRISRDIRLLQSHLRRIYREKHLPIPKIIAKIETKEAIFRGHDRRLREVDNFLDILEEESTFGIMIGRGDLGSELGIEKVPKIQERLIDYANRVGKPIIVSSQILESMRRNSVPTRAEAEDIYSAIKQGTDAVMLSGETASGNYPIEAVKMMGKIINEIEFDFKSYLLKFGGDFVYGGIYPMGKLPEYDVDLVGFPIVAMATGAKSPFILTYATTAWSATRISRFRPADPTFILALTVKPQIARVMRFLYKVCPVLLTKSNNHSKDLPRERNEVIDLFKYVINKIEEECEKRNPDCDLKDMFGEKWKERYFVAALAHQEPELWDVEPALVVFKLKKNKIPI